MDRCKPGEEKHLHRLNFLKFSVIVVDEFPKALRQSFKTLWDTTYGDHPGFQPWDDSTAVRKMFATLEGDRMVCSRSYDTWDCSFLFQATIYSRSFAVQSSEGFYSTLNDFYVRPRAVTPGSFHASVLSPNGDKVETFALAIDQLRRLRNSLCHSTKCEMDKVSYDLRINLVKDAFQALGVSTAPIDDLGSTIMPLEFTSVTRTVVMKVIDEIRSYSSFLKKVTSDVLKLKALLYSLIETMTEDARNDAILEQQLQALKISEGCEKDTLTLLGETSDTNIVRQNVAGKEEITRLEKKGIKGTEERDAHLKNSGTNCKTRLTKR